MKENASHAAMQRILTQRNTLTPKGKILGEYIMQNPRKAVFMTTKELAGTCNVSEATVVRFVSQLGYTGYGEFLQALRDYVDTDLTLLDRADLSDVKGPRADRLKRVVFEEMDNIKQFLETVDMEVLNRMVGHLKDAPHVYVIGSRLSYTFAYYLGWSLTKVRRNVQILKGSDTTSIDWLTIAPPGSLVVIIATSRYPNELIKIGKVVRRHGQTLVTITDSTLCPLNHFAHLALVAPSKHIPFIGSPTTISCIINFLVMELASMDETQLTAHQERLEQTYRENDILFNIEAQDFNGF
jgi:DNA-binding MurR/RpiR family transcriptional regulator